MSPRILVFVVLWGYTVIASAQNTLPAATIQSTDQASDLSPAELLNKAEHFLYVTPGKTIEYATRLKAISAVDENDKNLSIALRLLGQAQMFQGDNQLAYKNLRHALEVAVRTSDAHLLSVSNRALGVFYELILDYGKALDYYLKGLGYAERSPNPDDKATIYNNIGNVFNAQGAFDDAIRYFSLAIELYEQQDNFEMLMNAKVGLGVAYLKSGNLVESETTLNDVIDAKQDTSGFTFSEAMVNIAHIEKARANFDNAISLYKFVLNDEKGRSYPPAVAAAYLGLGESYVALGQVELARRIYQQGLLEVAEKTTVESEMALFERLSTLEMEEEEFRSAAEVLSRYMQRRNQVQPFAQQGLVSKLETQLALDRELLRLQEEVMLKERQARNNTVYLMGAVLFAMTSMVLVLILRMRKQALSRLENSNSLLKKVSETDPLTGVGNRRYLENQLQLHQAQAKDLAFLLLDIDHFKSINDLYGHKTGDHLLKDLAERVKTLCRKDEVFARIGGEEFVVILFGLTEKSAVEFARRIQKDIATMPTLCEEPITVSIGVSYGSSGYDELYRQADLAMYAAKHAGRNTIRLFSPELPSQRAKTDEQPVTG